jgi:hypothetical protein
MFENTVQNNNLNMHILWLFLHIKYTMHASVGQSLLVITEDM